MVCSRTWRFRWTSDFLNIWSFRHSVIWSFSPSVIQLFNYLGLVTWLLELAIGAVYPVLDAEPAVAGVELEVVEVVELGGEGEREVVAGVVVHHLQTGQS